MTRRSRTAPRWLVFLALAGVLAPVRAQAQTSTRQDTAVVQRYPLARFGKWVTLSGAAAAATFGIVTNQEADRRYADLERTCRDDPGRCTRGAGGAYEDATLEGEYQRILTLDDRATFALIAGEISVLASVVLFVFDLPRSRSGEDIPYSPPRLQIGPDAQGRLLISYRFRR